MVAPPIQTLAAALARKNAAGARGTITDRRIAAGDGWRVHDVMCTCGPQDGLAEERSTANGIALVLAGSFVARDQHGTSLLSAGSLFLTAPGRCFTCSHRHGEGDRCLSFQFQPELFECIAHETGVVPALGHNHLPALRDLSRFTARAQVAMQSPEMMEEVALDLAGAALRLAGRQRRVTRSREHHHGRLSDVLRLMAETSATPYTLAELARLARMSPYHFLRSFKAVTGVTPHQWLLRARLRSAAERLATTKTPVTEVALRVGFEDLSNFTRSFRAEFGASPREFRQAA